MYISFKRKAMINFVFCKICVLRDLLCSHKSKRIDLKKLIFLLMVIFDPNIKNLKTFFFANFSPIFKIFKNLQKKHGFTPLHLSLIHI